MSPPSFSHAIYLGALKSSLGCSSFILFLCILGGLGFCALVGELGKDPGYGRWDWKLVTSSSKEVRMGKC